MSFGGYKFQGYLVDNTQYSTSIERCLAIHAARVRSFLKASIYAGSPWSEDTLFLNGDISINIESGVLTSGVANGLIHTINSYNGTTHGYSSYFKYDNGETVGYYFILTTDSYRFDSTDSSSTYTSSLILSKNALFTMAPSSSSYNYNYAPNYASCLHCLSLEPFGQSLFNLLSQNQKSMKLTSIGNNLSTASSYPSSSTSNGFVGVDSNTTQYGYAIKDKDIIVFSGYGSDAFTNNDSHVVILSLNGFSELYNKDDNYPFLALDIKNNVSDIPNAGEYNSNGYKNIYDQVLSTTGEALIGSSSYGYINYRTSIIHDTRAVYNSSGSSYTPLSGLVIGVSDANSSSTLPFSNSTQMVKGCTNPELVSYSVSTSRVSNQKYNTTFNGSMLYLYSSSESITPNSYYYGTSFSRPSNTFSGYVNFYIGWDLDNQDILTSSAWPEYNAVIPT